MDAGIVGTRREVGQGLPLRHRHPRPRRQGHGLELEDLAGGGAQLFDIVDDVVDDQGLVVGRGRTQDEIDRDMAADAHLFRRDAQVFDHDIRPVADADQLKRARIALLDQAAQGVAHDPARVGIVLGPAFSQGQGLVRIVLGYVVQAVGDRTADIGAGVGIQGAQDRRDPFRVGDDLRQFERPGQARPAAFAGQPADVFVGALRPPGHDGQGPVHILTQKMPDGEFRRAIARKLGQGGHRHIEGVEAIKGCIFRHRHGGKAVVQPRRQAAQDIERCRILIGQNQAQAFRDLAHPLHDRQTIEIGHGRSQKPRTIDARHNGGQFIGDMPHPCGIEYVLQGRRRIAHLYCPGKYSTWVSPVRPK